MVDFNALKTDYSDVRLTTNAQVRCLRLKISFTILSNTEEDLGFESNWKREERELVHCPLALQFSAAYCHT